MNVTEFVDTAAESVRPLRLTWQRLMRSAGPHAAALRRSIAGLGLAARSRSEERRVGKECRSRWSPYH